MLWASLGAALSKQVFEQRNLPFEQKSFLGPQGEDVHQELPEAFEAHLHETIFFLLLFP